MSSINRSISRWGPVLATSGQSSYWWKLVACFIFSACQCFGQSSDRNLDAVVEHGAKSGNLAAALVYVATEFKIPVVAELAQPLPNVKIIARKSSAREVLDNMILGLRGYSWEIRGAVVHIFNRKLEQSRGNFLNLKFGRYEMPATVGKLQLLLPSQLGSLAHGRQPGNGYATSGFATLGNTLVPEQLRNTSGRDLLIKASNEGRFYVVIVFPRTNPNGDLDIQSTFQNWFWNDLNNSLPTFIQPPPKRPNLAKIRRR